MALPKRRTSKSRIRTRRHAHRKKAASVDKCPNCGAPKQPHRICPSCGYYKGRQVVTVETE